MKSLESSSEKLDPLLRWNNFCIVSQEQLDIELNLCLSSLKTGSHESCILLSITRSNFVIKTLDYDCNCIIFQYFHIPSEAVTLCQHIEGKYTFRFLEVVRCGLRLVVIIINFSYLTLLQNQIDNGQAILNVLSNKRYLHCLLIIEVISTQILM